MKKILLILVMTVMASTVWAQSQLTTIRGKTKEGKTIKVEYYKGSAEDYVESVKYQLVDELQARVTDLQTKLDAANKQIKELKSGQTGSSSSNNTEIKRLNKEIDELNKSLDRLQEQLVNSELNNDSIIAANTHLQEQIEQNGKVVPVPVSNDKELKRLRDSIVSKDATIRKLNNSIQKCEKEMEKMEKELIVASSSPTGYSKPAPVIGVTLGFGPVFAKEVEEGWAKDINWAKKVEVYFGTARLSSSFPISIEAGVGIRNFKLSAKRNPCEITESGTDADGDSFQAMYSFGTLQESLALTYLDIPVRVCFGQPAKDRVGVYAKVGVTPSIKIADKFQGTGTYSLKGYYPQWDVTLENITELGFGENMDYYAGKQATEVNNFVLWGNATIGAYVPFKGSTMLLNAGLGLDVPFMAVGKTNAGSKAVMPAFEIGMVYTLK